MASYDELFEQMKAANPSFSDEDIQASIGESTLPAPKLKPVMPVGPGGPVSTPQEMNPQVKEYIAKKFNLGEYDDDARKKLVEENSGYDLGGRAQAALAAIGAGFSGRDAGAAGQSVLASRKADREGKLNQFDKGRANKIQEYGLDREIIKNEREDEKLAREMDPNSIESKMAQDLAKSMGYPGDVSGLTAAKFKDFSPVMQKKYEIEQRKLDRAETRDERRYQTGLKLDEKRAEKARPSDKQIEAFTDLDNATSDLNNLLSTLGSNSSWTGSVDGRIPDMLVGEDQVAWRSAVGKYKDAYRKAITGAGAGPSEIARLETRLPSETDTYDNFVAKSQEALGELGRRKKTLGDNLSKGGKDVSKFSSDSQSKSQFPMQVRKEGKVATVSSQSELDEAKSEGWM